VREDDAEPEPLDDDNTVLEAGDLVAMAVKEMSPFVWRTFPEQHVALSEGGAVATQITESTNTLVTSGLELTEGVHYWEVELLSHDVMGSMMCVGVTRPNLEPLGDYCRRDSTDGWFILPSGGELFGNRRGGLDGAGAYHQGDRVGMLLDLDAGSLLFFKNGARHGGGYLPGEVTGPVVAAAQLYFAATAVRLRPQRVG
jgi:hypothetical protein